MNNKRVYIIHGWGGGPDDGFKPWLKGELESRGYQVEVPMMPDTNTPKIESWLPFLQTVITNSDENVILVGHSLGCQVILRYLDSLPEGIKVGKAVMVAGVVDQIMNLSDDEKEIARPWLDGNINAAKVKRSAMKIIAFFSDNDRFIPLSSEKTIREAYEAETIIEHNMGHYNDESGIREAPSVLSAIINDIN